MKVTLQVNGREMTFSEQELAAIVKKHLSSETDLQIPEIKVAQTPTEDAWFEVRPQEIDQKLFEKERENEQQEKTRRIILEAFAEVKRNPKKYARNFRTMMPKKDWTCETVRNIKQRACKMGDHIADWVEQALEWAQRIANGESWENICNDKPMTNWYRLVEWKDGSYRLIGGAINDNYRRPASYVYEHGYRDNCYLYGAVPLVVLYE